MTAGISRGTFSGVPKLNIVYLGMVGRFSSPPLERLLAHGHQLSAVVLPAFSGLGSLPEVSGLPRRATSAAGKPPRTYRALPQLLPPTLDHVRQVARDRGIPLLEVRSLDDPEVYGALAEYRPDVFCVACFPWLLPARVLQIPRLGSVNIHPSLLPDNRGPDPLFWTFRRGDVVSGVTVHLMDERFDSGPVLGQAAASIADGTTEHMLEERLAELGGQLLEEALAELVAGTRVPVEQDGARATYYSYPRPNDWIITPDRSARWAYNFASGLGARSQPILVEVGGDTFQVLEPLDFEEHCDRPGQWRYDGQVLELACAPGLFRARAARRGTPHV